MTKSTLSRSVKATPKVGPEPDTNGTPPTDQPSEATSEASTDWVLHMQDGTVMKAKVKGGRGRISFSSGARGGQGELRIYRNESTKVFDAAFHGVDAAYSDRVEVEKLYEKPSKVSASMFTASHASWKMASAPAAPAKFADLSPQEQDEWVVRAGGSASEAMDLYEREMEF